jgi:hypothetical protein
MAGRLPGRVRIHEGIAAGPPSTGLALPPSRCAPDELDLVALEMAVSMVPSLLQDPSILLAACLTRLELAYQLDTR